MSHVALSADLVSLRQLNGGHKCRWWSACILVASAHLRQQASVVNAPRSMRQVVLEIRKRFTLSGAM